MEYDFRYKQFGIIHSDSVMKVGTDGVLLGAYVDPQNAKNILDIGTGTGLIALMLAQKSDAKILAIDITKEACELAEQNFSNSPWSDRLIVRRSNLKSFVPECKLDLIISNPPFYSTDIQAPDRNRAIARHTIELLPIDIIAFCKGNLSQNGKCYVIYPVYVAKKFIDLAYEQGLIAKVALNIKGNYSSAVIRQIVCVSISDFEISETTISIEKEKRHDYTPEYRILTGEYYLKF